MRNALLWQYGNHDGQGKLTLGAVADLEWWLDQLQTSNGCLANFKSPA